MSVLCCPSPSEAPLRLSRPRPVASTACGAAALGGAFPAPPFPRPHPSRFVSSLCPGRRLPDPHALASPSRPLLKSWPWDAFPEHSPPAPPQRPGHPTTYLTGPQLPPACSPREGRNRVLLGSNTQRTHQCPKAAVTNDHELHGLKRRKCFILRLHSSKD